MAKPRHYCLSIGGFDPSAGAGILADIKTFEQHNVYGLGVITANTVQTDSVFVAPNWLPFTQIKSQLALLLATYPINVCKIGLVKNFKQLIDIIKVLQHHRPKIKIIWDPVLSASAGTTFHTNLDLEQISHVLDCCYLVTPNIPELNALSVDQTTDDALSYYRILCNILLKGGHSNESEATDRLYLDESEIAFSQKRSEVTEKHGTGCILSSAIAANLVLRQELQEACKNAKNYTYNVIISNQSKLGYHHDNDQ